MSKPYPSMIEELRDNGMPKDSGIYDLCIRAASVIEILAAKDKELGNMRQQRDNYRWMCSDRWYIQVMSDLTDRHPKFCVIGTELDEAIGKARKP